MFHKVHLHQLSLMELVLHISQEKFEDTKVVIGSRKSNDRQYNGQKIPKWWSEAVNQTTDNTMVRRYQSGGQKP